MTSIQVAEMLAADLAGARVDPNEAQKALAYLRSKRDAKQFFSYLRAIVDDGRAVIRSGQTLDYYRNLLVASERHLRGLSADEMAQALGWAIRLLRYYRAVPGAEIVRPAQPRVAPPAPAEQAPRAQPRQGAAPIVEAPPERKPAAPRLPAVGDTFLGRVLEVDESGVAVEIAGFGPEQALGVIKPEHLGGKRFSAGNMARVEVTGVRQLKSGRTIVELKPGAKKLG